MAIKYLYIDDSQQREGIARGLSVEKDKLVVEPNKPESWANILYTTILPSINDIDGLLLDWQLQSEADKGDYSSSALAQQLRELVNQGSLTKDIPIILCSAQAEFSVKFERDKTSHDLFDLIYSKKDLTDLTSGKKVRTEFESTSVAYRILNEKREYLGVEENEFDILDLRFKKEISNLSGGPPHEIARFLKKELVDYQGLLVDEDVLSARLGINSNESQDWGDLKAILSSSKYTGIFHEGWERWWWHKVDKWWKDLDTRLNLQLIGAEERVSIIKNITGLNNLVAAKKSKYSTSDEFWTVCFFTRKPIDIYDGFILNKSINQPWQERILISNEAALSGEYDFQLDILEKDRFNSFKDLIKEYNK